MQRELQRSLSKSVTRGNRPSAATDIGSLAPEGITLHRPAGRAASRASAVAAAKLSRAARTTQPPEHGYLFKWFQARQSVQTGISGGSGCLLCCCGLNAVHTQDTFLALWVTRTSSRSAYRRL